uniref:Uncharacterized protein n=1 Tax=Ciona savignyi TaxID=51511 RepID=H2ZBG7_CIOSA
MRNVAIKCAPASRRPEEDRYSPVLFGSASSMIVTLHFDDASFHLLPVDIQKGKFIKLHPVLYNIGINEEQTLAEKFGSTAVQEYLNHEAIQSTFTYYDLIRDQCPNSLTEKLRNANSFIHEVVRDKMTSSFPEKKKSTSPDEHQPIMELLIRLKDAVDSKRNKNVEILQKAGDVCRRLNGVRLTSCKSAKDRTAMSVTLEQARILTMEHGLA